MFLDHNSEYNSYSWNSLRVPDGLEPDKEIRFVNVRPKVIYNRREYEGSRSN